MAVLGTQCIATLIAVYGLFMTPLGWKYAGFVWAYAIVWALFTDRIKLLAYRILDPSALPLLAKKQTNYGPEISKEAYELYQQRARGESQQNQDWLEAERLIKLQHEELPKASRVC
jgi:H+-transporting ATPase